MSYGPGIFIAALSSGAAPEANAAVLQSAINDAQASSNPCGAVVLIPSFESIAPYYGPYSVGAMSDTSPVITVPAPTYANSPLLICGTGEGTQLLMQPNDPNYSANVLFDIQDSASVTFQDLTVKFAQDAYPQSGTAFNFTGGSGHALFRVEILDCQYPIALAGCDDVRLLQCFIHYGDTFAAESMLDVAAIQITSSSSNVAMSECLLAYYGKQVPEKGYTGIVVSDSSDITVRDTQITNFLTGISISGAETTSSNLAFSSVRTSAFDSSLTIQPSIYNVSFTDCRFESQGASGPGICVGSTGNSNASLDTISFTSCFSVGNYSLGAEGSYGLQINAGQNIQVNGGRFSGNGSGAGIGILGAATEVQINGANCVGLDSSLENKNHPDPLYQLHGIEITAGQDLQITNANCSGNGLPSGSAVSAGIYINGSAIANLKIIGAVCAGAPPGGTSYQQYGIYVAGASGVLILDSAASGNSDSGIYLLNVEQATIATCDGYGNAQGIYVDGTSKFVFLRDNNVSGYTSLSGAISFGGLVSNVEVTDCAGYNDQKALLAGPGASPPSGTFTGITVDGYYGPTTFYLSNGGQSVTIDGQPTYLHLGAFTLGPGDSAAITTGSPPSIFLMIGT